MKYVDAGWLSEYPWWHRCMVRMFGLGATFIRVAGDWNYIFFNGKRYRCV